MAKLPDQIRRDPTRSGLLYGSDRQTKHQGHPPHASDAGIRIQSGDLDLMNSWLTANEAAAYLRVQPRTLLLWARQGKVPAHRLSGIRRCIWRFLKCELDGMLGVSSADSADGRRQ
jgi:excisionase family DNA binding protein